MSESLSHNPEENAGSSFKLKDEYRRYVPTEFLQDPLKYFYENGKDLKPKPEHRNKVKEFEWHDDEENNLQVVAKRVKSKGEVAKSGDPFYEYSILEKLSELGLPAAEPIGKIQAGEQSLFLTKRIPGITIAELKKMMPTLEKIGYTSADYERLKEDAECLMTELHNQFEQSGVEKGKWKLSDMVIDVDFKKKIILGMTPTDWEHATIETK